MWRDGKGEDVPAGITAGELADDPILAVVTETSARQIRRAMRILLKALDIREDTAIRLPVLFRGNPDGREVTALLPNPINLVCLGHHVILLKPFGPRPPQGNEW